MFGMEGEWYQCWMCFNDFQFELLCNVIFKICCVDFGDGKIVCGDYYFIGDDFICVG